MKPSEVAARDYFAWLGSSDGKDGERNVATLAALLDRFAGEAVREERVVWDAALAQLADASRCNSDTRLVPVAGHCRQLMEVHPESKMLLLGMAINIDHAIESGKWAEEKITALRSAPGGGSDSAAGRGGKS